MTPWLWLGGKASESESWCGLHTGSDFESWHPEPGKTSFEIHPWWRLASCLSIYHIQGSIPDAVTEGSVSLRSPIPSQHSSPTHPPSGFRRRAQNCDSVRTKAGLLTFPIDPLHPLPSFFPPTITCECRACSYTTDIATTTQFTHELMTVLASFSQGAPPAGLLGGLLIGVCFALM